MPKYTPQMIRRDETIYKLADERGWLHTAIAKRYGLSTGRVTQILAKERAARANKRGRAA